LLRKPAWQRHSTRTGDGSVITAGEPASIALQQSTLLMTTARSSDTRAGHGRQ